MKVLLDCTQIPLQRTGVGVYADRLLEELPKLLQEGDQLIVLGQDDDPVLEAATRSAPRVRLLTVSSRVFRNRLLLLVYEQCCLPLLLTRHRVDVVHSMHYTFPVLSPCPRAVTIHDLTYLLFPQMHTRGRRTVFRWFIRQAFRRVEALLYVSRATRQDAELEFSAPPSLGFVTPLGVLPATKKADRAWEEVLRESGVTPPYVLFVGTVEPRKNLPRLLEAFCLFAKAHPEYLLVIAGKLGWAYGAFLHGLETSPVRDRVRHLGFVSEEQKGMLLGHCAMLVYPSLYEGFGLPVLEGMAHGAPVITSSVSSLPEVAGDAALIVDPENVQAIAAAMDRIVDEPGLAEALRVRGEENVTRFTWQRTARATYDAYRAIALRAL